MFYCDKCAKETGWGEGFVKSHGTCEVCGEVASCSDVPSRLLPLPKTQESLMPKKNCYTCGTPLTEEEVNYYGNTCEKCEGKTHQSLEEDVQGVSAPDTVNHPAHYTAGKIETIDIIDSVCSSMDLKPMEAVYLANVLKYVSRFKFKGGMVDLKKAAWYLERLIGEQEVKNA